MLLIDNFGMGQISMSIDSEIWHPESADPEEALGPSDVLDRNPVVDIHYLLFATQQ